MDDELQTLEDELKRLRPARVPDRVTSRVAIQLDAASRVRVPRAPVFWFWAALPAAAALAVLIGAAMNRDLSPRSIARAPESGADASEVMKPVTAENVLYAATDEGIITLEDGTRARRERLSYVDTITWKNPHTNASLKWSMPREEVRVVPISFQ